MFIEGLENFEWFFLEKVDKIVFKMRILVVGGDKVVFLKLEEIKMCIKVYVVVDKYNFVEDSVIKS